jgi:hypothetical protein
VPYERIHSAQPLMPPGGASSQRLITSDRVGQAEKEICEGSGGVYTEHCPSMAQVGVMGPMPMVPAGPAGPAAPLFSSMPCVKQCEMPSGLRASAGQERPGTRWDPALEQLYGYGGGFDTAFGIGTGVVVGALSTVLYVGRGRLHRIQGGQVRPRSVACTSREPG